MNDRHRIYTGLFLVALSTLALEITLTRMLSVITWYHLAFLAISLAMLGMTAGAVTVYARAGWFDGEKLQRGLAWASLGYALTVPASLIVLCSIPLRFHAGVGTLAGSLLAASAPAVPFYFSGIVVSAALTRSNLPPGKVYASDLAGAALGCALVLAGLEVMDAPSLIILCGSLGALASVFFLRRSADPRLKKSSVILFSLLFLAALLNSLTPSAIRPTYVKELREKAADFAVEKWNSFSRVTVSRTAYDIPWFWGRSPATPTGLQGEYRIMKIDGAASTPLNRFTNPGDLDHLRYDVTNIGYAIRPTGGACVIGVGGGRDIQSALLFGHQEVTGIDINPIFIDLLTSRFRGYSGLADRPGVTFVVDEARSCLSRSTARYSLLQMSLIDTWAATAAGAFSLSENGLYTVEAWRVFLARLKPDGIFMVSRWYNPNDLGETGRLVSLAVAALSESGRLDPSRHLALVTASESAIATLLVSSQPFADADIKNLMTSVDSLRFELAIVPGRRPQNDILARIVSSHSVEELEFSVASEPMNFSPPTDENPYFFNMLRLGHLNMAAQPRQGVITGNLAATITLLVLIVGLAGLCVLTIAVPLRLARRAVAPSSSRLPVWTGAVYFSLIGTGFMFLEIALMQRLSVFLGHPTYAIGILLFTLILSAGIGSAMSGGIDTKTLIALLILPAAMVILIGLEHLGLQISTRLMITSPIFLKILLSIALIMPAGILMGFFFPVGLRLVNVSAPESTPWFWALNGIFGVLSSALAVFISIYVGISANFAIAAACYGGLMPCLWVMWRKQGLRMDVSVERS